MKTRIGKYDPATGTVSVLFTHDGVEHRRPVNACLTDTGDYDAKGTRARVADVARGVIRKIEIGAIGNEPSPEPAPSAEPVPPPADNAAPSAED